ncbi:MAG: hypothetical protein V3V01_20020 [Acidimicrobiales bacterium]
MGASIQTDGAQSSPVNDAVVHALTMAIRDRWNEHGLVSSNDDHLMATLASDVVFEAAADPYAPVDFVPVLVKFDQS